MHAISTVIATVLMLTIVIALAGTSYMFISGVFTSKTSTAFSIIDSYGDSVTIRNDGVDPITSFSTMKIDGSNAVYRVSTQDSSLVGYWKFDEGHPIETAYDSSGNNNNGDLKDCIGDIDPGEYDCPDWFDGKFGKALYFDGSSTEYVDVDSIGTFETITLEAWVSRIGFPNDFSAVINNDGWAEGDMHWQFTSDNKLRLGVYGTIPQDSDSNFVISSQGWHHIIIVYDKIAKKIKFYLDGELDNEVDYDTAISANVGPFWLGAWSDGDVFKRPFKGIIDEVKIYNRALTNQEIKAEHDIGKIIGPGEIATIKIYDQLSKGTHTLRLCTSSMCNTAYLTIQ